MFYFSSSLTFASVSLPLATPIFKFIDLLILTGSSGIGDDAGDDLSGPIPDSGFGFGP